MDNVKRREYLNYSYAEESHRISDGDEEIKIISKGGITHLFINGVEADKVKYVNFIHNDAGAVLQYTSDVKIEKED